MKKTWAYILVIVALYTVLVGLGTWLLFGRGQCVEPSVIVHTDTVTEVVYDTAYFEKPTPVEKEVRDTLWLVNTDTVVEFLPIYSSHYTESGLWDVWTTGTKYCVLDSVRVYPKTVYTTVTTVEENTVEKKEPFSMGVDVGFLAVGGDFVPHAGIYATLDRKWLISANFGYNNSVGRVYVVTVGHKLF